MITASRDAAARPRARDDPAAAALDEDDDDNTMMTEMVPVAAVGRPLDANHCRRWMAITQSAVSRVLKSSIAD